MKRIITAVFSLVVFIAVGCNSGEAQKKQEDANEVEAMAPTDSLEHPIRNENNHFVTLETNYGKMTLELYHDIAPAHADSFLARVRDGFYDNTIFHRVVKNFMIQGGNPRAVGKSEVSYSLRAEFNDLPHKDGTLSMARTPDPNSAKTQFFICLGRNRSTEYLDGKYTNFGQLVKGYDVLHSIGAVEVEPNKWMGGDEVSAPVQEVRIVGAYESDPYGNPIEGHQDKKRD
jgi:cyclophilin family peptidyl-prolyl cis-trans isomerase